MPTRGSGSVGLKMGSQAAATRASTSNGAVGKVPSGACRVVREAACMSRKRSAACLMPAEPVRWPLSASFLRLAAAASARLPATSSWAATAQRPQDKAWCSGWSKARMPVKTSPDHSGCKVLARFLRPTRKEVPPGAARAVPGSVARCPPTGGPPLAPAAGRLPGASRPFPTGRETA